MAFLKRARAEVVTPAITHEGWEEIRYAAVSPSPSFEMRKATQAVLGEYDPGRFLLSHCTIVASVDTESPVGFPLGKHFQDGMQIDRRYPDFYVTAATSKYINNNQDAFERKLLLSSFRTFVGGQNYVEHVQIPELSKGRIIDAAARDIGDSIYIDILIGTEQRHQALIQSITSGELNTLSMGCTVTHTICTKCGNAAEDETQLCRHVRYEKGQSFIDGSGKVRRVAELCGHHTAEPGSVRFIEASWVDNPAFKGAVLRNVLDPQAAKLLQARVQSVVSLPPPVVDDSSAVKRAASTQQVPAVRLRVPAARQVPYLHVSAPRSTVKVAEQRRSERLEQIRRHAFDDGMGQGDSAPVKESDPLKKVVDDLSSVLVDQVADKVRKQISETGQPAEPARDENWSNESLIKSAMLSNEWRDRARVVLSSVSDINAARRILAAMVLYSDGGWERVRKANRFTGTELLVVDRLMSRIQKKVSAAGDARIYRTVVATGGTGRYPNVDKYLEACARHMGRGIRDSERLLLVTKGKLFSTGL